MYKQNFLLVMFKRLYKAAVPELTSSTAKTEQYCLPDVIIRSSILVLNFEFVEDNLKRKVQITAFFLLLFFSCVVLFVMQYIVVLIF